MNLELQYNAVYCQLQYSKKINNNNNSATSAKLHCSRLLTRLY